MGGVRPGACAGTEKPQDDLGAWLHKGAVFDVPGVGRARLSQLGLAGECNAEVETARMQGVSLLVQLAADDGACHTRPIPEKRD